MNLLDDTLSADLARSGQGLEPTPRALALWPTVQQALQQPALAEQANQLAAAMARVGRATKAAWATGEPADALANAVPYMQAFGHMVLAWIWLDVALSVPADTQPANQGKLAAMRYFFHYELPKIGAWLQVVSTRDATCAAFPEDAF
eukprot:gene2651-3436_t